jgi:soluble lytic murein transglycosylase
MSKRAVSLALASLVVFTALPVSGADAPADADLAQAREAFRAAYPEVERGNWAPAARHAAILEPYVLWPDIRAAWFRASIKTADHGDVEAFLDEYGVLKPARELRYQYALHLADEDRLDEYLSIYQQYYQGLNIARLDCLALQAELEAGRDKRIVSRSMELWLVGRSQVRECDPVFANLKTRNILTKEHHAERFAMAIDQREFRLARYLSGPLPPEYRETATTWLRAQEDPRDFIRDKADDADTPILRRQLAYAVERIAFRDPRLAKQQWDSISVAFAFEDAERAPVSRHIALWAARLHDEDAAAWLADLPKAAQSVETGRWLVRACLLAHDWPEVVRSIDALPADERERDEWQYWRAVALTKQGESAEAAETLTKLAGERSYHGFLAADAMGIPYAMNETTVSDMPGVVDALLEMAPLVRARELFMVGLDSRGRSEWDAAITALPPERQLQAARLAHEWGWHSRAITTVASAGDFDQLELRYPLPWRADFRAHATAAGIPDSWAYGIARSESLFMRDVRSSAGAIGIMQLMPATGRSTAREISLPYAGLATLTDSNSNIRLGTWYLGKMYSRFDNNRVLATAAYNAGPHRVEAWLPDTGTLDARIWIANIPFNETRGYVRRVLTDEAIFHWRLTGQVQRLSAVLPRIDATPDQLATAD